MCSEALAIWSNSDYATVFSRPDVLKQLADNVAWWAAKKGSQIQCLWPVCPSGSLNRMEIPPFCYYIGPIWAKDAIEMPAHRWLARSTQVYEEFIGFFLQRYRNICASLPLGLHDVRVFDWWNYSDRTKPRFSIRPRYTATIRGVQELSRQQIESRFRTLRRRELKAFEKAGRGLEFSDECSSDSLVNLYEKTFEHQNAKPDRKSLEMIEKLVLIARDGTGSILALKEQSRTIAATLILYGKAEANLCLNLADPEFRDTGVSARLMLETICQARAKGVDCFDFNGANSPTRGDDKHSYGSRPELFFQIEFEQNLEPVRK